MAYWGDAPRLWQAPGFWTQMFGPQYQLDQTGGTPPWGPKPPAPTTDWISHGAGLIKAGYRGIELPNVLSPWKDFYVVSDLGQRWCAGFTAKMLCDYYDFTLNRTFLAATAYPYVRLVGDFYLSYMTHADGHYHVLHSCAMEGCHSQGAGDINANITLSNDPPVDLAFAKRTFRNLIRYSEVLGVDEEQRSAWRNALEHIAPYPLTKDEDGNAVFAQASTGAGFPLRQCRAEKDQIHGAGCYNARYPIVYFAAIHPGEEIDLASDAETVEIARRTVSIINDINHYKPVNSLAMAWPPSSRVVNSSTWLLDKFERSGLSGLLPNFLPSIGGTCAMEQSGATVAINDLLVSVHGHGENASMVLFPGGWPAGEAISFQRIRIKGAFTVSADAVGAGDQPGGGGALPVKLTGPVRVTALATGQNLTFAWWPGSQPSVTVASDGAVVAVKAVACGVRLPCFRFATTQGVSYELRG